MHGLQQGRSGESVCPFGHHVKHAPEESLDGICIEDGLEQIRRAFWEKHGDKIEKSSTPEDQENKRSDFRGHRERLKVFLGEHQAGMSETVSCPFQAIYDKARVSAAWIIGIERAMLTSSDVIAYIFIQRFREAINTEAKEFLKPKDAWDEGVSENIMGPLAPWECTIRSIVELYETPGMTQDVFLQAWPTIVRANKILGMHLATRHVGRVGNHLAKIMSSPQASSPYFSISMKDRSTKITWRENALAEIIKRLNRKNWKAILNAKYVRKGPLIGCPAASVKAEDNGTVIEMGVEKVGNSIYQALFQDKK